MKRTYVVTVEDPHPAPPHIMESIWLRPYAMAFNGGVERITVRQTVWRTVRRKLWALSMRLRGKPYVRLGLFPVTKKDKHVPGGPRHG